MGVAVVIAIFAIAAGIGALAISITFEPNAELTQRDSPSEFVPSLHETGPSHKLMESAAKKRYQRRVLEPRVLNESAEESATQPTPPSVTRPSIILVNILFGRNPIAVFRSPTSEQRWRVAMGDTLLETTVAQITPDTVTLEAPGASFEFKLQR